MSGASLDIMSRGMKRIAAGLRAGELKLSEERPRENKEEVQKTVSMELGELIQKRADIVRKHGIKTDTMTTRPNFRLKGPCQLTVKIDERYSNKAFIGEENLTLYTIYEGKKEVVFVFLLSEDMPASALMVRETYPLRIEMTESEAGKLLAGFKRWSDIVWEKHFDLISNTTRVEAQKIEDAAHEAAKIDPYKDNPLFGSW